MSATEQQPSVAEVLLRAADLIEPEGAWTQNHWAQDESGSVVPPRSREATCWCLDGALVKVKGTGDTYRELHAIANALDVGSAMGWNDAPGRTQAEVVTALRQAAALTPRPIGEGK